MNLYMIWNPVNRRWWSNEALKANKYPWVTSGATIFTEKEKQESELPPNGEWFNLTVATEPVIIDKTKEI